MRRIYKLFLIVFLSSIFFGCETWNVIKPGDKLPAKTQEGKNTFGCLINGKLYLPETTLSGNVRPLNFSYYSSSTGRYKRGSLFMQGIDARYSLPIAGDLAIQKKDVYRAGKYKLKSQECSPSYQCDQIFYFNSDDNKAYLATSGELIITRFDTVLNIVSGTFEFEGEDGNGKTVKVTSGRFDVKFERY